MPINKCPNSQCEFFNRPLPNNAKVCPFCGSLVNPDARPVVPDIQSKDQDPLPPPDPQPPRPHKLLKLIHKPSGREFCFFGEDGYIGRKGQTTEKPLAIDLTGIPDDGIVSRVHARIYWDRLQDSYMIVDNNSTNGTFLNGTPLKRGVIYPLNQGNSLQLGQDNLVSFTVSIK